VNTKDLFADEEETEETTHPDVRVIVSFSHDKFIRLVNYPVIVEAWGKQKNFRGKRLWLEKFTEEERQLIGKYYKRFHGWYLVGGPPPCVLIRMQTLDLMQRAVDFFATV